MSTVSLKDRATALILAGAANPDSESILEVLEYLEKADKALAKKDIVLEYMGCHPDDKGETIVIPGDRNIYIGKYDIGFLESIRELPVNYQLLILKIKESDIVKMANEINANNIRNLQRALSSKWTFKETGEPVCLKDASINEEIFGVKLTANQILGKIRRETLKPSEAEKITAWFETSEDIINDEK